jgi:uncharacterized membrane protein
MKNTAMKIRVALATASTALMMMPVGAMADVIEDPSKINGDGATGADFSKIANPIVALLNDIMTPLLAIVGAAGALYCVILGVKFAKAGEPQEREKAKTALKNAIIGFVLIFVLILALNIMMPQMVDWVNGNA